MLLKLLLTLLQLTWPSQTLLVLVLDYWTTAYKCESNTTVPPQNSLQQLRRGETARVGYKEREGLLGVGNWYGWNYQEQKGKNQSRISFSVTL